MWYKYRGQVTFILKEGVTFDAYPTPDERHDVFIVEGEIECKNGLRLAVNKMGEIERDGARRVRMLRYRYEAWFPGKHQVLRYDNNHPGEQHRFHRHEFDPISGTESTQRDMRREEFPVMNEVLDELMNMFGGEEVYR